MLITTTDVALLKLLQFSSATLPVGAYAFSQGLETAVESDWVSNSEQCEEWLRCQLSDSMARVDIPILYRMLDKFAEADVEALNYWNSTLLACRETQELSLSDLAMGEALNRLLNKSNEGISASEFEQVTFLLVYSWACFKWRISSEASAIGYIWAWLENQVAAATKLVPLGQTQAQMLLNTLQEEVARIVNSAALLSDDDIGSSLPALAIASAMHETQYTRLFRS